MWGMSGLGLRLGAGAAAADAAAAAAAALAVATVFYVSQANGSDAGAGTRNDPWKTAAEVNTQWAAGAFGPGDVIAFNRGDNWNPGVGGEEGLNLTAACAGIPGAPIIITAGGDAALANPIFAGMKELVGATWTEINSAGVETPGEGVWGTPHTVPDDGLVVFDGGPTYSRPLASHAAVKAGATGATAFVTISGTDYVLVKSVTAPSSAYASVQATLAALDTVIAVATDFVVVEKFLAYGGDQNTVSLNKICDFVTIQHFEAKWSGSNCVATQGRDIVIDDFLIHDVGGGTQTGDGESGISGQVATPVTYDPWKPDRHRYSNGEIWNCNEDSIQLEANWNKAGFCTIENVKGWAAGENIIDLKGGLRVNIRGCDFDTTSTQAAVTIHGACAEVVFEDSVVGSRTGSAGAVAVGDSSPVDTWGYDGNNGPRLVGYRTIFYATTSGIITYFSGANQTLLDSCLVLGSNGSGTSGLLTAAVSGLYGNVFRHTTFCNLSTACNLYANLAGTAGRLWVNRGTVALTDGSGGTADTSDPCTLGAIALPSRAAYNSSTSARKTSTGAVSDPTKQGFDDAWKRAGLGLREMLIVLNTIIPEVNLQTGSSIALLVDNTSWYDLDQQDGWFYYSGAIPSVTADLAAISSAAAVDPDDADAIITQYCSNQRTVAAKYNEVQATGYYTAMLPLTDSTGLGTVSPTGTLGPVVITGDGVTSGNTYAEADINTLLATARNSIATIAAQLAKACLTKDNARVVQGATSGATATMNTTSMAAAEGGILSYINLTSRGGSNNGDFIEGEALFETSGSGGQGSDVILGYAARASQGTSWELNNTVWLQQGSTAAAIFSNGKYNLFTSADKRNAVFRSLTTTATSMMTLVTASGSVNYSVTTAGDGTLKAAWPGFWDEATSECVTNTYPWEFVTTVFGSGDGLTITNATKVWHRAAGGGQSFLTDGWAAGMAFRPGNINGTYDDKVYTIASLDADDITSNESPGADLGSADTACSFQQCCVGITRSGSVATVDWGVAHGLAVGDYVLLIKNGGASDETGYAGFQRVTSVPTASTFTFTVRRNLTPTTPSTAAFVMRRFKLSQAKVGPKLETGGTKGGSVLDLKGKPWPATDIPMGHRVDLAA